MTLEDNPGITAKSIGELAEIIRTEAISPVDVMNAFLQGIE
jgi:hypothetical protein